LGTYWLLGTGSFHDWVDGLHGIFYVGFNPKMSLTQKFLKTLRASSRRRSIEILGYSQARLKTLRYFIFVENPYSKYNTLTFYLFNRNNQTIKTSHGK